MATVHVIELTENSKPVRQFPYLAGPGAREVGTEHVTKILKHGIIDPANTPWSSPVVLVPKKDVSYRFCVYFRRLNLITIWDSYQFPRMD